ncbi:hypothetical protein P3342_010527 [Pyrenophora teres f. teres]|nr:hypothetical protein P3342_010527 [Pyrenophora teres f. teres]
MDVVGRVESSKQTTTSPMDLFDEAVPRKLACSGQLGPSAGGSCSANCQCTTGATRARMGFRSRNDEYLGFWLGWLESERPCSRQDGGGVPLAIAHDQRHFRLLELPPDIVGLLDAPDPPLFLSLKSRAPAQAAGTPNATAAYAVLCTPDKTFQLRQVQTSNSLLVTHPILQHHGNDEMPIPATCAIASCTATLQLHVSTASAVGLLSDALSVYDIVAGDVDATPNGRGKPNVFADMPVSDGECEAAWTELMAFEVDGSSYQPSASALSQVWRAIHAAALAEGIPLNKEFMTDDITRAAAEEGHPQPSYTLCSHTCRLMIESRPVRGHVSIGPRRLPLQAERC